MTKTIEVEIDAEGHIHPLDSSIQLPAGRALLVWPSDQPFDNLHTFTSAFDDWLRPEEDEAWAHLQPKK